MTSEVRYATEKRAQDRANQSSDPAAITNKIKPTQSEPAISANLTQTPNTNQTSRFDSWTLLCLGTERRYPDRDDTFHSAHYARRPRNFKQVPKARINAECRICKILKTLSNHEGALYADHYGNFPTHCPQWARMDINEKKKTALAAEYCLRCFASRIFVKTGMDAVKHHEDECYVKVKNKDKFTCLNQTSLQHSLICSEHTDENSPLLEAIRKESANENQVITFPRSTSHMGTIHPPPMLPPKQLAKPVPPSMMSSTTYKSRVVKIPFTGLQPALIMARLKNRTPAGDTPHSSCSAASQEGKKK